MSTITDVARAASVSVATVSRVINGAGNVTEATARRVREAINRLEYRPNVWGQSLRSQKSSMLLVLVPNITNPYYAPIISGVEDVVRANGYNIRLCMTDRQPERRRQYIRLLYNGQAAGAIAMDVIMNAPLSVEAAQRAPLVQCCEYCEDENISHVSIDNVDAARQCVFHLLKLGHGDIGLVGSTNHFISTRQRTEGYEDALHRSGVSLREDYIALADENYSFDSGVKAAGALLDLPRRPTALFCISDVLALGAVRAAEERGLRVPEDLTVVGFDDVEYAAMFRPNLTTVRQPCYELGRAAASLLLDQMAGGEAGQHIYLPYTFIERDSSAPRR